MEELIKVSISHEQAGFLQLSSPLRISVCRRFSGPCTQHKTQPISETSVSMEQKNASDNFTAAKSVISAWYLASISKPLDGGSPGL